MAILLFFVLASLTTAQVFSGSLGGFQTYSEMYATMANITSSFPKICALKSVNDQNFLVLSNYSFLSPVQKTSYLITGSIHSGNPLSSASVLSLAYYLASKYASDPSISYFIDRSIVVLVPVLNSQAYLYTQQNYNSSNFVIINTDLSGADFGCKGVDIGINPDRNFPFNWKATSDKCSNSYSGTNYLTSNVTVFVSHLIALYNPVGFFNLEDSGYYVYYPYASSNQSLNDFSSFYYKNLAKLVPNDFNYTSMFSYNGYAVNGNLLDYAFSLGILSLQVNVLPITTNLVQKSNYFNTFLISSMQENSISVTYNPLSVNVNHLSQNSTVTFSMLLINSKALGFNFSLNFNPGFQSASAYQLYTIRINSTSSYYPLTQDRTLNYTVNSITNVVNCNYIVNGYTDLVIQIEYIILNSTASDYYSASANFASNNLAYYYDSFTISGYGNFNSDNQNDSDGGDNNKKGMVTGLVLLVVLLALLIIAGIVLYCKKKRVHEPPPDFVPNLPNPQNPNYV